MVSGSSGGDNGDDNTLHGVDRRRQWEVHWTMGGDMARQWEAGQRNSSEYAGHLSQQQGLHRAKLGVRVGSRGAG